MAKREIYLREDFKQAWQGQDPFIAASRLKGKVYRALENRKTLQFEMDGKKYFIKIHKTVSWGEIIKNIIQLRLPIVSAHNEWRAIAKLKELDIDTLTVVAYGRKGFLPATLESFLVTEDLGNVSSLEDVCARWQEKPPEFSYKFELVEKIAGIGQLMHRKGICHRDFYICHFFLYKGEGIRLSLIDLHRALIKKSLSQRWIVKDIGSLYFSAMEIGLTKRDLLRFIKTYSGKSLRAALHEDTQFWSAVERRAFALKNK